MLTNLLFYRWLIFNMLIGSFVGALWWNGYILPLFQQDQSNMSYAIAGLFVLGFIWCGKEVLGAASDLNSQKVYGALPGIEAQRTKDLAKVEWLGSVSEWLTGLGLLGTVIGFAIALGGIDQATTASASGAQAAVAHLMQGMRVALNTTLLGAALAIWNEINVRILRTGLEIYWADRMVAYHNGTEPDE